MRKPIFSVFMVLVLATCLAGVAIPGSASAQWKDKVTVAVVNFHAVWGNKSANLYKMEKFIEQAVQKGAEIILFPETATTGYEVEPEKAMHKSNAETIPGPLTDKIAELTRKHRVYIIFGMPERDKTNPKIIYNSAAVVGPNGVIGSYKKIHPWQPELQWCVKGREPFVFKTPWGPVGIGICYDNYFFPEVARMCALMGARLYLNATAVMTGPGMHDLCYNGLKARAQENWMFVASANLVGKELTMEFWGGSVIFGPNYPNFDIKAYVGPASYTGEEVLVATLDLSNYDKMHDMVTVFGTNPFTGERDYRQGEYRVLCESP